MSAQVIQFPRTDVPKPALCRRLWIPGLQYEGETLEQMDARENRCREDDARADAEIARLWAWKNRPWWET